jgi:hypothetical protein
MKLFRKILHGCLILLTAFLAITGFLGGVGLLAKLNAPPLEQLNGTIFTDWTIPGLSLFVIVGGSALIAAILLFRKSKYAGLFSATAGIIIMFFEFVEVLVIGSPAGIARTLQIFYFGLGTVIEIVSMGLWFIDLAIRSQVQTGTRKPLEPVRRMV